MENDQSGTIHTCHKSGGKRPSPDGRDGRNHTRDRGLALRHGVRDGRRDGRNQVVQVQQVQQVPPRVGHRVGQEQRDEVGGAGGDEGQRAEERGLGWFF